MCYVEYDFSTVEKCSWKLVFILYGYILLFSDAYRLSHGNINGVKLKNKTLATHFTQKKVTDTQRRQSQFVP